MIRLAKPDDLDVLYEIYAEYQDVMDEQAAAVGAQEFQIRKKDYEFQARKMLLTRIQKDEVLLSENGEIQGFVHSMRDRTSETRDWPPTGVIDDLGVRGIFRGRGLGEQLIDAAEQRFIEQGCTHMVLEVWKDARPQHLYERLGYKIISHRMMKQIN